jgi:hypothetical protein
VSHCKFFATAAFILCTPACFAGELKASDIEVVAVIPRSPDVKPYAMAVPDDGHRSPRKGQGAMEAKSDGVASLSPVYERAIGGAQPRSHGETPHDPISAPSFDNQTARVK